MNNERLILDCLDSLLTHLSQEHRCPHFAQKRDKVRAALEADEPVIEVCGGNHRYVGWGVEARCQYCGEYLIQIDAEEATAEQVDTAKQEPDELLRLAREFMAENKILNNNANQELNDLGVMLETFERMSDYADSLEGE